MNNKMKVPVPRKDKQIIIQFDEQKGEGILTIQMLNFLYLAFCTLLGFGIA